MIRYLLLLIPPLVMDTCGPSKFEFCWDDTAAGCACDEDGVLVCDTGEVPDDR